MTVTALILGQAHLCVRHLLTLESATLGVLFVNVFIGGTLTPFAVPPLLMVAGKWRWDITIMMSAFGGGKAAIAQ